MPVRKKTMDSIFADKKSFKAEFKARAVRRYARDIDHLSNDAWYQILGSMVKEQANIDCKSTLPLPVSPKHLHRSRPRVTTASRRLPL